VTLLNLPVTERHGKVQRSAREIRIDCPPKMWWYAADIDIGKAVGDLGTPPVPGLAYAVDLEIEIETGSVGVVLTLDDVDKFASREQLLDARPSTRRVTLESASTMPPRRLLLRNTAESVASRARIQSAVLRFSS
jgi:hypothetical protein